LPVAAYVHRVLDARAVGGAISIGRQRTEPDDLTVLLGHDDGMGAGSSRQPFALLRGGPGHEIERHRRLQDLDVVDRPDRLVVGGRRQP
jgi:hypothetical protein